MNPFDLHGPEFLVLYTAFGVAVLVLANLFRLSGEPADVPVHMRRNSARIRTRQLFCGVAKGPCSRLLPSS